jgi:Ser/Thr protein kinase RdoA (MazF antagonist)
MSETMTVSNRGEISSSAITSDPQGSAVAPGSRLLPVTHSVIASDALLQHVAHSYEIGEPRSCELLCSGSSDTYLLNTSDKLYVARVYRTRWRSLPEVEYELALLKYLATRGISVPMPIADKVNLLTHTLSAPEGSRCLALFGYVEGSPVSFQNTNHAYLAGQAAAQIHAASDDFVRPCTRSHLDLASLVDEPLSAIRPLLVSRPDACEYLEGLAGRLRPRAESVISGDLDWGLCHGDFGHKNLLLNANGGLTVLDFDHCAMGWRVYDFTSIYGDAARQGRLDLYESFLNGYTQVRPLSAENLAAVPLFRALRHLFMLGMFAHNAPDWGTLGIRGKNLDGWLSYLREWETEHLGKPQM